MITRIEQAIGIDKIKQYLDIGLQPLGHPMMMGSQVVCIMVKEEPNSDISIDLPEIVKSPKKAKVG